MNLGRPLNIEILIKVTVLNCDFNFHSNLTQSEPLLRVLGRNGKVNLRSNLDN